MKKVWENKGKKGLWRVNIVNIGLSRQRPIIIFRKKVQRCTSTYMLENIHTTPLGGKIGKEVQDKNVKETGGKIKEKGKRK